MMRTLREFSHWLDGVWVTESKGEYTVYDYDPYGIKSMGENLRTIADKLERDIDRTESACAEAYEAGRRERCDKANCPAWERWVERGRA